MTPFPRPAYWTAEQRDASMTYDHKSRTLYFLEGPLSNNYAMQFDAQIGDAVVLVNSATQAILLHKAALFQDQKTFDAIAEAKQFKKMLSLAEQITGLDDAVWQARVQSVVNQVIHEKFLMDLWLFDTLCLTADYTFKEQPGKPTAVSGLVLESALSHVRGVLQKEPAWVRAKIPPCHVVNKHYATADVDIARGTPFGNDFEINETRTREEAIAQYKPSLKQKIRDNVITKPQLLALVGKRLGCTCVPNACHGHVLTDAVKWAASTEYEA